MAVELVISYMSNYRLTPEELRSIDGYKDVTDEEAELIIDDAIALARICLDLID